MKLMEINVNNVGIQIRGIAWRLKNVITDKVRELPEKGYYEDLLEEIIEQLTNDAEELDFIGEIFANSTDEEEK